MRHRFTIMWTGAIVLALVVEHQCDVEAQQKLTFNGDTALWTVAIKPDKTADFEKVMAKLHEGLLKSSHPDENARPPGGG